MEIVNLDAFCYDNINYLKKIKYDNYIIKLQNQCFRKKTINIAVKNIIINLIV